MLTCRSQHEDMFLTNEWQAHEHVLLLQGQLQQRLPQPAAAAGAMHGEHTVNYWL